MKKKMKTKMKRIVLNASIIAGLVLGLAACDNELNTIGSDILGADQLNDRIKMQEFDVVAFNELLGPVQTNNFSSMPLGSYNDPIYGRTDYSFVTQLSLPSSAPSFGDSPVLDSVVLSIPYYSRVIEIDGDARTYEIDSLYGGDRYHLQIFQNNYFLNDFNPDAIEDPAVYFSDLGATIEAQKGALVYETFSYLPSPEEVILTETDENGFVNETERLTPRLRVPLDKPFWENTIINQQGTGNLGSNSNFQNYFRGLYFKISSIIDNGNLVHLNINEAEIVFYLTISFVDVGDIDNDGDTMEIIEVDSQFTLSFDGNRASLIDNSMNNPLIISDIQAANDDVAGEERLYLKGGPGSMVLLDLFGPDVDMNGEADELTQIIENNWIINEASLTFFVDQAAVEAGSTEPERIIIYNFDDDSILADFSLNPSINALNSNINHLGRLERVDVEDESSQGVSYKLRLTQHINSIINGDIENVRLALAVTQNVNLISNGDVKNPNLVEKVLTGSAISHEGTILHGNLSSDPDKRLKFEIFYTDPNPNN